MPTRLVGTTVNAMMDAGIGTVANSGKLRVYSGTQPITGGAAITDQVKLLEFIMNVDAFPPAAVGVLFANAISSVAALATGKATWYRLLKSDGTTVLLDGGVGEVTSSEDLKIDSVNLTLGQVVSVVSLRYTMPRSK